MSLANAFAVPEAWPALLLAPAAAAGMLLLDRARTRRLARITGPRVHVLATDPTPRRRLLRLALATAALLLAGLTFMQPLWGDGSRTVTPRGVDLVVCLDVSRSMLARDIAPSRILFARRAIHTLAAHASGDRLALVAFAGDARLCVPLTRDRASFEQIVDQTDELSVTRGGTDIATALEAALRALEGGSGDHSAILLVTDGEDTASSSPRVERAAAACRERGISVHCVGIGSDLGAKIPIDSGGSEAFLRDTAARDVISVMDSAGLRRIAAATTGSFIDAATAPEPLAAIYDEHIAPVARASFAAAARRGRESRFQWPLAGAFLLWMLGLALPERRRP